MRVRVLTLALTLSVGASALPVEADTITWTFSEQISIASGPYAALLGTDIYGVFSFDANQSIPSPSGSVYTYALGPLVLFLPALDSVWTYASGEMDLRTNESCRSAVFPQCMILEFFDPTSSNPHAPPPPNGRLGSGAGARTLGFEMNIIVPAFSTGELPIVPPPDVRVVGAFWNAQSCSPICGTSQDLMAAAVVPEPSSLALFGAGLLAAAVKRRRSRRMFPKR